MKHHASSAFWRFYGELPGTVRKQADKQFALIESDPSHPSLQLKPVGRFWSARVNENVRALAVKDGEDFVWFWIGAHKDYERLIK